MHQEHLTFAEDSEVRADRQVAWQGSVDRLRLDTAVRVVLPGAESLVCLHDGSSHQLFEDVWASNHRFTADPDLVRSKGLRG